MSSNIYDLSNMTYVQITVQKASFMTLRNYDLETITLTI